jgi:energy-coupling factor transporter transmembrane protein EcfT
VSLGARTEPRRRPRREPEITFLRLVPGDTVVHRLWAGTKLLVAAALALLVSFWPTWRMLAVAAGVVALGLVCARIPAGAFPRLPAWFLAWFLVGGALSLWSRAKPTVDVGGISLSLGGLEQWARFTALAIVLVASGALIGWTTPLGEVAPALKRLFRPLRWLRLPVDEWVLSIALAIRCVPLLIDEIRTLAAARRLRTRADDTPQATVRQLMRDVHDLLATAIVTSMRRARDIAEAMVARGGVDGGVAVADRRLRPADYLVLTATVAVCVVSVAVLHL